MEPDANSPPSFEQVISDFEPLIHRLISQHIPDPERALDLTQETFVTAYRTYPDLQGEQDVRDWLLRIALSHCKADFRRQWKEDEEAH